MESEECIMMSIGEFSKICEVSAKTLRYYDEIELIRPNEINPENGYRYYSIEQLETMLFINRLKSYNFSLDEIKSVITSEKEQDEILYYELNQKKKEFEKHIQSVKKTVEQLKKDIMTLKQGKSIMSYLDDIDVQLVEMPKMYLLSVRKMVHKYEIAEQYRDCFGKLAGKVQKDKLTIAAPPIVLYHGSEFSPLGLDMEFAIPIKEYVTGTRDFCPGLCLKTVLHGSYSDLPSVYAKQCEWAAKRDFENKDALFEIYVTDPSQVSSENELVTEIYYPIKKLENIHQRDNKR